MEFAAGPDAIQRSGEGVGRLNVHEIARERRRRAEFDLEHAGGLPGVTVAESQIGGVGVRVHRAAGTPTRRLVWLHGGGFVFGDPTGDDPLLRELVDERTEAISVRYPLAPEHPYPAALDAALQVVAALPGPVVLGGASAGAAIAAGAAIRLRDRGYRAAGLMLICPALDDRARHDVPDGLRRSQLDEFWSAYRGSAIPDGAFAVARTTALANLPRTDITTTDRDPLRVEAWTFAARLAEEHVPVTVTHLPGGFHGFEYEEPASHLTWSARRHWAMVLRDLFDADAAAVASDCPTTRGPR